MTSAYLTELRQRLGVTRDRLDEELRKVPVDYSKAAFYELQIKDLREDIRLCSTSGGELLLSCCSSFSQTSCLCNIGPQSHWCSCPQHIA